VTHEADSPLLASIGEHYVVDRVIGRGGMATVYLCHDTRDDSRVAVKVLRKELGSSLIIERFLREIAFASELDHPRIPKVFESGIVGDLPYYAMTYVEGESLKRKLEREKQLPLPEAIHIACEVIAPTAYAHSRGIVHRDIKPDNILIAKDGVYVLDFGIARAIIESGVDRLTSTGVGVGTPAYMSPEQALGDRNLDARSDIYSLGCVLYEMIAGIPPFVGPTSQAIISRRFAAPPPPLREVRDGVPEDVEDVVQRALARAPADRWPTVAEFGKALEGCSTDTPSGFRKARASSRRRSMRRIGAAAAILAAVAVGVVAWSLGHENAFEKAQESLQLWDLDSAERDFRRAVASDPGNADAQLWLAQVLMLQGEPSLQWKTHALRAFDNRSRFTAADKLRTDALVALASDNFEEACRRFTSLTQLPQRERTDFTAELALADCLRDDRTVLPDPGSPSGYRFRTSRHQADVLYEGLLARNQTFPSAYSVVMPRLEQVLAVDKGRLRRGQLASDKRVLFSSHPSLASDTLAYVPYSIPTSGAAWRVRDPVGFDAAVVRNRQRLRSLALEWIRLAPDDPDPHATLARILEATGELSGAGVTALSEVSIARKLTGTSGGESSTKFARKVRIGSDEVRLFLRLKRFANAGLLADSILAWPVPDQLEEADQRSATPLLRTLAALRGRGVRAIELSLTPVAPDTLRLPGGAESILHPSLVPDRVALGIYASFGGPKDSITAMARRLSDQLPAFFPERQLQAVRSEVLLRRLLMAAPVTGPGPVAELEPTSNLFALALKALARDDRQQARRFADSMAELHADNAPGQLTMDVVYREAWLSTVLGDTAAATRQLENALGGLSAALPVVMRDPYIAAFLVRVMALRAELASRRKEPKVAKYWADAVFDLWGKGDLVTRSTLDKVRRLR
jgi:tRNA A-37 threonylcarbamoyl transferase component Bud32/tetratricopeptide (TPR) repeat protein